MKGCRGPHLILAPKAVLPNWRNEFKKWSPDLEVCFYDGSSEDRRQIREGQMSQGTFNVILTHYDLVMRDKTYLKRYEYETLIVDEGHRLKNAQSKLSDILREMYTFKHRFLLTGTPIQNSIDELWALLNFVLPKVFNSSGSFDEWFAAPFQGSSEDLSQQLNEEENLLIIHRLHQVIRPFMLRRTKREVEKELPNKIEQIVKCDLSAWQRLQYTQVTNKGKIEMGRGRMRLQNQVSNIPSPLLLPKTICSCAKLHQGEDGMRQRIWCYYGRRV
jgi:SNF2 family DNA or RNA helicase